MRVAILRREQRRLLKELWNLNAQLQVKYDHDFQRFVKAIKADTEPLTNDGILKMRNTFCVDRKERSKWLKNSR